MSAQSLDALALANRIRLDRAALKRRIKAGEVGVAAIILSPPECARTMTAAALLRAQDRWGHKRVMRLLTPLQIGERRELRRLTTRQRSALVEALTVAQARTARGRELKAKAAQS